MAEMAFGTLLTPELMTWIMSKLEIVTKSANKNFVRIGPSKEVSGEV